MKTISFILLLIAISCYSFSEEKYFVREYKYTAGESDSKITAREKAIKEVKTLLLEELGTYVESYVNYNVKEVDKINTSFFNQEINTMSAGITETKILEENWNGYEFYIKAQIKADPNEVVRRINQTLSARRSNAVIDRLRILLKTSNQDIQLRSKELTNLKAQLSDQNNGIILKQKELSNLNQQLTNAQNLLSKYQVQENQILSDIQTIENKIKNATTKAVNNVRLGMTPIEVTQVCGTPRSTDKCSDGYTIIMVQYGFNFSQMWSSD